MNRAPSNAVLAVGYVAVAVAVIVARYNPATGYEASIYGATPTVTWMALGLAFAIAIGATLTCRGIHQAVAIGLGGLSITSMVSLPLVRGYHFMGMGDALTHLGWIRDFIRGEMLPHELFYPGLHSLATLVHLVGGVPEEQAVMFAVVFLFVPFVIFVPLVVRNVTGNPTAVAFAAIAAWFVLPINNVATHMGAHSNSNALFFAPVVIFAIFAYLGRDSGIERLPLGWSPYGVLILVSGAALLFIHPQQMINVVVLLAAITAVQYLARRRYDDHPILEHSSTGAYTFTLGAFFLVWSASNARFRDAFSGLLYGVVTADIGGDEEVGQREASLTEIGGSLPELFVKMFLVSALVGVVVSLFLLVVWIGRSRADPETRSYITYLGVSLFPLGAIFLLYFLGTPTMAFRQVGFIYVVMTILGGIALGYGVGWLQGIVTTPGANALAAIAIGACMVLALMTLFSSPIIYSPTQHVSEQTYGGYETSLEHGVDDRPYAGYGYGVYRYSDGIYGVESIGAQPTVIGSGEGTVEPEAFNEGSYSDAYPDDEYYLVVSEFDTTREFEIYQELNYERAGLEGLEAHPETDKYVSNDEFRLYAVSSGE